MIQIQSELFDTPTQKLSLVDVTLELPAGFHQGDPLDEKISAIKGVIRRYLENGWALFDLFSGGKDSSVKLCLVLNAMREYVEEHGPEQCPPLAIMHSDTLLENPVIALHTHSELARIRLYALEHSLPVTVHVAMPSLSENYLVNIIGGRTIATTAQTSNRKCSVSMKVGPIQRMQKKILADLSSKYEDKVLTLVGKRYDESEYRKADMIAAGERPDRHIKRGNQNLLSPIASMSLDDIFWIIGLVTNNEMDCYSNFESLIETYRAANNGECMVNAAEGKAGSTSCGARYGCWVCLASEDDKSMNAMMEQEEYKFMRHLWAFRNYLQACHNDPSRRTWLARKVNADGTLDIRPNSYSPEFTEELLKMAISIQVMEEEAAHALGISPRFQVITFEEVMAIECQWSRYGYHRPMEAVRIWNEIYEEGRGLLLPPSDLSHMPRFPLLNDVPQTSVPFVDEDYYGVFNGLRDMNAAMTGCEDTVVKADGSIYTAANTSEEFSFDPEGLYLFATLDMKYAINKFADGYAAPGASLHYLMNLGIVSINKGSHSEYDRMLRMSSQIWRHGLRPILNDPKAIVEKLGADEEFKLQRLF
ncbi:phosphoadenosine phosphosulfate reductase family protein [Neptuniibacter halophilus]|uniref:phosphoadenosine phosphosulfate reductase family protein n=1 Tax=Neptuniibacter halophilus TaxID=651666 RepID=UPI0025739B0C|nr:phosphoadenosine phosphosulfate reductase family protein [Neptuniibacter halophilus]